MTSEPRRLHSAAIAVLALGAVREAAVPLVVLLVVSVTGGGLDTRALARGAAFLVAGGAIATLTGLLRWRSTTYRVDADGIHLRTGIITTKETTVPLSRVQALDTVQGPIQRLFGVVALHVQTAGGGAKGEIVLQAVAPAAVEEIREAIGARRPEAVAERAADAPERRLSGRMLLVAALTAGQLGVILPALAGASQVFDDVFTGGDDVAGATRLLPDTVTEWALAVAALLVAAWALSVIGAIVAFAGFSVMRDRDRLRIRRGLLQRSEQAVPVARVHGVRVVEGLLRRPFGLAALRLEVAGYAQEAAAARTLFPLLHRGEVRAFLEELLPELADDPDGLTPPPRRAARRYALPPALLGAAAGGAAWLAVPSLGPWPLLAAPLLAANGWLSYRAAGWRLGQGRLALRSRGLAWVTLLAPTTRLQQHEVAQSPLQRRARLADLGVAVGKGSPLRVRHLEDRTAWELWERLRPRWSSTSTSAPPTSTSPPSASTR
jgi:putative membrane protein